MPEMFVQKPSVFVVPTTTGWDGCLLLMCIGWPCLCMEEMSGWFISSVLVLSGSFICFSHGVL